MLPLRQFTNRVPGCQSFDQLQPTGTSKSAASANQNVTISSFSQSQHHSQQLQPIRTSQSAASANQNVTSSRFNQSQRHNLHSLRKSHGVSAVFSSQAKAQQRSERLVDSEQYLRSNEANDSHLNAGISLKSSNLPPVGKSTSWWTDRKLARRDAEV